MSVQKVITYNPVNLAGEKLDSTCALKIKVLENSGNYLIHKDILRHHISTKQGTSSTKTRSEVRGGGRKPWKQKGTGRARHGSTRSPIWVGGGVAHGPRNDKNYDRKVNKKMKVKAIYTILSQKLRDGEVLFLNSLALSTPKTKDARVALSKLGTIEGFEKIGRAHV